MNTIPSVLGPETSAAPRQERSAFNPLLGWLTAVVAVLLVVHFVF